MRVKKKKKNEKNNLKSKISPSPLSKGVGGHVYLDPLPEAPLLISTTQLLIFLFSGGARLSLDVALTWLTVSG